MTASTSARFAPVGALRIGLVLLIVWALMYFGPLDGAPGWVTGFVLVVGLLLTSVALGIRMLRD